MPYTTSLTLFINQMKRQKMQFDMTMLIIWWVVPIVIIAGRAGLAGYRAKKKRDELKKLEENSTPFTRKL
ncbi:MAG: hypothetical protein ACFFDM_05410 [Candidatus Thorarchaeota archaeon]